MNEKQTSRQEQATERSEEACSLKRMVGRLYGAFFIGSLCWLTALPSLVGLLVWASVLSVGVAAWMRETRKPPTDEALGSLGARETQPEKH